MACSEARLAANRANAQHSTGPRTDAGKDASRRNAWKHGLAGAGVVVPAEDEAELARRTAALRAQLAVPGSEASLILAERVAVHSVRLARCVRHESASLAARVRRAHADFDADRHAEAARRAEAGAADLLAMPEGVDLALARLRASREGAADAEAAAALDAEVAALEARRATLDHDAIAAARAEAGQLALVAVDRDALLAQRYEAAAERAMFRAFREIQVLRRARLDADAAADPVAAAAAATAAAQADLARHHATAATRTPVGSFGAGPIAESMGSFGGGPTAPPRPVDPTPITAARPDDRRRSRYEDRKRRPKFPR